MNQLQCPPAIAGIVQQCAVISHDVGVTVSATVGRATATLTAVCIPTYANDCIVRTTPYTPFVAPPSTGGGGGLADTGSSVPVLWILIALGLVAVGILIAVAGAIRAGDREDGQLGQESSQEGRDTLPENPEESHADRAARLEARYGRTSSTDHKRNGETAKRDERK